MVSEKKKINVLITCGPTWVPIDQVRVISNTSTGSMGHFLADAFVNSGATVTLLQGKVTHQWQNSKVKVVDYVYFNDLLKSFKRLLTKRFDVVVHAAAVSDFTVANSGKGKLNSDKDVTLKLTPTPKLLELIKKVSPASIVVGFKLEPTISSALLKAKQQLKTGCADMVVANSSSKPYKSCLIGKQGQAIFKTSDKRKMAQEIAQLMKTHFDYVSM